MYGSLQQELEPLLLAAPRRRRRGRRSRLAVCCVAAVTIVAVGVAGRTVLSALHPWQLKGQQQLQQPQQHAQLQQLVEGGEQPLTGGDGDGGSGDGEESISLSFEAHNKYTKLYGRPGTAYPWVDDLHQIVEPYRVTRLTGSGTPAGLRLQWSVGGRAYSGPSVTVTFTTPGEDVPLLVQAVDPATGDVAGEAAGVLHVRFVKRELRKLDEGDLKDVLDAMEMLYRVREAEGRELFGPRYRDAGYFIRLHNSLAGTRGCDAMHDGMGFLTQHVALSLDFERSLHAVNPSVTLPYWDYTIDAVAVDRAGNAAPFFESPIWAPHVLGPFPENGPEQADNGDHAITTGRWANIPVAAEFWGADDGPITNGWGSLRSPWNVNGAPVLTRGRLAFGFLFDSIPNCADHVEQMALRDFSEFGLQIQYKPHGSMHTVIGGSWGVDYYKVLGDLLPWAVVRDIALRGFGLQKDMWRKGLLECPNQCPGAAAATAAEPSAVEQSTGEQSTAEPSAGELSTGEQPAGEQSAGERSAGERSTGEQSAEERLAEPSSGPCACFCPELDQYLADGRAEEVLRRVGVQQRWLQGSNGPSGSTDSGPNATAGGGGGDTLEAAEAVGAGGGGDGGADSSPNAAAGGGGGVGASEAAEAAGGGGDGDGGAGGMEVAAEAAGAGGGVAKGDVAEALLRLLCNADGQAPAIGDAMSSSAPVDPTFWVLHPAAERLWQWARLNGLAFSWPEVTYRHEPGTCFGHGLDDPLSFKNLFDSEERFYTNAELYELLDPARFDVVDYVYDDFVWQHCEDEYGLPAQLLADGTPTAAEAQQ